MWKINKAGIAENLDDPQEFIFVQQRITIVKHYPNRYEYIDAGFVSREAAQKELERLVKKLNAEESHVEN